jgi:hypothetical protein
MHVVSTAVGTPNAAVCNTQTCDQLESGLKAVHGSGSRWNATLVSADTCRVLALGYNILAVNSSFRNLADRCKLQWQTCQQYCLEVVCIQWHSLIGLIRYALGATEINHLWGMLKGHTYRHTSNRLPSRGIRLPSGWHFLSYVRRI